MTREEFIKAQLEALTIYDAMNKMMNVHECAKFLNCHPDTVKNCIKSKNKHNKIIAFHTVEEGIQIPKYQFYKELLNSWGYYEEPNYPNGVKPYKPIKKKTYLMLEASTGFCKIGISKDPKRRETTLQSQKPDITLYATSDNKVEKTLHIKYDSKRVRGEWFNLSGQDIEDIIKEHSFKKVN
ncbi:GIY-YIG nuclease family protein [Flagellimonas sp. CMM7]|uniref:GIY-YIG nuclease family protein n=1 Tax=Flagellimonas sp. CMM7 TaxID=2654676 RepID=UPI0013D83758|nr:GIY-YIG nuclease family protein [Flagellimonas sp. CMM7]UII80069.1 GIY-YIG nuclease family protein [Flagellimonas sp. CMM7]